MSSSKLTPIEGLELSVPCLVSPGAFSSERFVKVDAQAENKGVTITAFVPDKYVEDPEPNSKTVRKGRITTIVRFTKGNDIGLLFPGELLSVSNPVRVSKAWLTKEARK